ncbi:MAG TPA: DUF456 domain-containing protein [Pirellulales bacterium]|nr:DUF456 domain-containing protein [Pirellulales bacterium]
MSFLAAALLCVAVVVGWLAQLIGLPGNWLIVACAAVYAGSMPADARVAISWQVVIALACLAALGEIAELAAGALGVAKVGGSRRSAVLALLGSVIGGFVGLVVGLPIPVIGSLAAAVLFAGLGAMAGAILGESSLGRDLDASVEVGKAAFVGRLIGTLAKMLISSTMVAVTLGALAF